MSHAFLILEIDADVYMDEPEGFKTNPEMVCKLRKSLYGTKQASRLWYNSIDNCLISDLKFKRSEMDPCIYYYNSGSAFIFIMIYVNNILIISNDSSLVGTIKAKLKDKFNIRWISTYLGISCQFDPKKKTLFMEQPHIVDQLMKQCNMVGCKPVSTPVDSNINMRDETGDLLIQ